VLVQLRRVNPADRQLYWLFENVSSMQPAVRQTISRFFEVNANSCADSLECGILLAWLQLRICEG